MKKLILASAMLLATLTGYAQNDAISRFFNEYSEDERFTVVYISPKMFQLVAKIDTDDPDWQQVREIVKDLGGLRVLTADSISGGLDLYKSALNRVPVKEYEELLTVRDQNEHVRIWIKDTGNIIEELLLLVGAPDEFTMLSITGKIDLDKISALSKTLDIEGVEHLDKVKGAEKAEEKE